MSVSPVTAASAVVLLSLAPVPPAGALTLSGRVVDSTGAPLAFAGIAMVPVASSCAAEPPGRAEAAKSLVTQTDAAGRFALAAPGGVWSLQVAAGGRRVTVLEAEPLVRSRQLGEVAPGALARRPPAPGARGARVDEYARPESVARAPRELPVLGRVVDAGDERGVGAAIVWLAGSPQCYARTDEGGRFALFLGPNLAGSLVAGKEGFTTAAVLLPASAEHRSSLVLAVRKAPAAILGEVVDSRGGPVRAARVTAAIDATVAATGVDEDGRFRLEGLPGGEHRLKAEAPGYVAQAVAAHAAVGSAVPTARVVLHRPRRLAGRVVDQGGRPLAGVRVRAALKRHDDASLEASTARDVLERVPLSIKGTGRFSLAAGKDGLYFAFSRTTRGVWRVRWEVLDSAAWTEVKEAEIRAGG